MLNSKDYPALQLSARIEMGGVSLRHDSAQVYHTIGSLRQDSAQVYHTIGPLR